MLRWVRTEFFLADLVEFDLWEVTRSVAINALSAANVHLDETSKMSTPKFHRSIEGVPRRVTLTIPANFMLIATLDKQVCVASPDRQRGGIGQGCPTRIPAILRL
jgi:hypothetical protein